MFLPEDFWCHLEVDLKLSFNQDEDELLGAFGRIVKLKQHVCRRQKRIYVFVPVI